MWKTIILKNDTFRKLPVIRLEFPYDLEGFNRDYIIRRKYSASYQSQVINGVKLYFGILEKSQLKPDIIKRPKQLPNVLSKEEIMDILQALTNLKLRFLLLLTRFRCKGNIFR